jgi:hypothetical protein
MRIFRTLAVVVVMFANGAGLPASAALHGPVVFSSQQQRPLIASIDDLKRYLVVTRYGSPLDALTPEAKGRFLSSLAFTSKGLASFSKSDLRALTATQAYEVLRLFGAESYLRVVEPRIVTDEDRAIIERYPRPAIVFDNYKCYKKGDCAALYDYICTEACA